MQKEKLLVIQVNGHGTISLLLANTEGIRYSADMLIHSAQSEYQKSSSFINEKSIIYHTVLSYKT